MTRSCTAAFRRITSRACWTAARSAAASLARCVHPRIAFSGVRSSWERTARNSSFSRLAASASARAAVSSARSRPRSASARSRSSSAWRRAHSSSFRYSISLSSARALLQRAHLTQARLLVELRVELGGDDARVPVAHVAELTSMRLLGEVPQRITAQERDLAAVHELVPELLQADRAVRIAILPQEVHHLPEGAHEHAIAAAQELAHHIADAAPEPLGVRPAADHEGRERLPRVEEGDAPALAELGHVEPHRREASGEPLAVRPRGDHEQRLTVQQPLCHEGRHPIGQAALALVKLDDVVGHVERNEPLRGRCVAVRRRIPERMHRRPPHTGTSIQVPGRRQLHPSSS
nr:hypothetical protein [Sorangium cellulosum]